MSQPQSFNRYFVWLFPILAILLGIMLMLAPSSEAAAEAAPRIRIAHLSPFSDSDTAVNISFNHTQIASNVSYLESTQYIDFAAGHFEFSVVVAANHAHVLSEGVTLHNDVDYTLAVIGDGQNRPFELAVIEDDNSALEDGNFRLRLAHFAPFAERRRDTRVDIRHQDGAPILLNVRFEDVGDAIELPAGEYDLKITTPGGETTLIDPAPATFAAGDIANVFAVGDNDDQPLGIFAYINDTVGISLPLAEPEPARLYVAHLAPFGDDAGTSVTIKLNGEVALENIIYGNSTGYIELPAGGYLVEILPTGTDTVAISGNVNLEEGTDYTAIAIGDGANQDLALLPLVDDNSAPASGNFKLRLGHLAPFADSLAGTTADVRLDDGTVIIDDVQFGSVADYIELPAGTYDLQITTPDGSTTLIDIAPLTFGDGDIVTAVATGEGVNQPLGAFGIVNGAVGAFLPLEVAEPETARLYVAHLAPFGDDDATSVTVKLNGDVALENVKYGDSTGYLDLPAGSYLVEILPTGTDTVAISGEVELEGNTDYTAIAIGDGANQDLALLPLVDDNSAPAAGTFKLRLGHLAPFADSLAGTTADVRLDDGTVVIDDVQFGTVADYIELPAGEYDLQITTPDGATTLIDFAPLTFAEGDIVTAAATGEGVNQPLGGFGIINGGVGIDLPLEVADSEPEAARLYVAHLAPFGDDDATSVTIKLNGNVALENVKYGDSTGYLDLPAGSYLVEILPTGTETVAISGNVDLEAGTDYTAIAIGDGANQDLALLPLLDDNSAAAAGTFKLRLGHLAPFADTLAGTTADVRLDDGTLVVDDVQFGTVAGYIELPAGEYDLQITTPDGATTLIDFAPLTFAEGDIVTAVATGEGVNQPLGGFGIINGGVGIDLPLEVAEPETTRLYVAHLAPFGDDDATSVTIKLNGDVALENVKYGDSTGYLDLPAGSYLVEILPTGTDTVAISGNVELEGGVDYTAIAIGDGANQDLALLPLGDDNSAPAAGNFKLRLGHLAPFADTLAGTTADVRLQDGTVVVNDVQFGTVAGYVELPAGEYDLKITTPDGVTTLIDPLPATFAEGDIVTAVATGEGVNQDLGAFAIVNGEVGQFLPLSTFVRVLHQAPFATNVDDTAVRVELNGVEILSDFKFGDATDFLAIEPGSYLVEIFPVGSDTAAISGEATFEAGQMYSAVAIGNGSSQPLSLMVMLEDMPQVQPSMVMVNFGNLAPHGVGSQTIVDIRLKDGTIVIDNLAFGQMSGFISLNPGTYDFIITNESGSQIIADPAPITLNAGSVMTIVINGDNQNIPMEISMVDETEVVAPAGSQSEKIYLPMAWN